MSGKYNTPYSTTVALVSQTTGAFQGNPTLAVGDVQVSRDDDDFINIEVLPSLLIGGGNTTILTVNLSATEMSAARTCVLFHDVSGNEWRDLYINVEPEVNLVSDVISGSDVVNANVTKLAGSTQAATNLKSSMITIVNGSILSSGSNTDTTFKTDLTGVDDFYGNSDGGGMLIFTSGACASQSRRVTGFVNSTGFITVESAFDTTPSTGDLLIIIGHIEV